ncbi:hypothetical protein NHX12_026661 [Muraenolepis orangiensis]|uniref:Uncharacterized protein n=1 Tax=Muraenolepis orangiensis TaxID=630683 RepID=A0A9Q0EFI8_9TELE|nr:hypothetical protein NHX12_026661 [Muraenolepis orangiensis]
MLLLLYRIHESSGSCSTSSCCCCSPGQPPDRAHRDHLDQNHRDQNHLDHPDCRLPHNKHDSTGFVSPPPRGLQGIRTRDPRRDVMENDLSSVTGSPPSRHRVKTTRCNGQKPTV